MIERADRGGGISGDKDERAGCGAFGYRDAKLWAWDCVNNDVSIRKALPTFITISAIGQEKITEDAFNRGADYYIMKPFYNDMVLTDQARPAARRRPDCGNPQDQFAHQKGGGSDGAQS